MPHNDFMPTESHAFVLRIWVERRLAHANGRPLWRGRIQHATTGEYLVFEAVEDLMAFILSWTGPLEEAGVHESRNGTSIRKDTPSH